MPCCLCKCPPLFCDHSRRRQMHAHKALTPTHTYHTHTYHAICMEEDNFEVQKNLVTRLHLHSTTKAFVHTHTTHTRPHEHVHAHTHCKHVHKRTRTCTHAHSCYFLSLQYEQRIRDNPNDAEALVQLGNLYVVLLFVCLFVALLVIACLMDIIADTYRHVNRAKKLGRKKKHDITLSTWL